MREALFLTFSQSMKKNCEGLQPSQFLSFQDPTVSLLDVAIAGCMVQGEVSKKFDAKFGEVYKQIRAIQ